MLVVVLVTHAALMCALPSRAVRGVTHSRQNQSWQTKYKPGDWGHQVADAKNPRLQLRGDEMVSLPAPVHQYQQLKGPQEKRQ